MSIMSLIFILYHVNCALTFKSFTRPFVRRYQVRLADFTTQKIEDKLDSAKIQLKNIASGSRFIESLSDALTESNIGVDRPKEQIEEIIESSPIVIFSSTTSKSCIKAKKCFDDTGCKYRVI